jgi:hypothetical protein
MYKPLPVRPALFLFGGEVHAVRVRVGVVLQSTVPTRLLNKIFNKAD